MNRKLLNRLRVELQQMWLRSAGLRSSELVRLAKSFERTASKRGKEPTYINETLPYLRPLSIPGHPGTLKKGTALSILNHLEAMPMPSMQYCPLRGMKMSPNEILKKPYARVLVPDPTGGFFAEILEFPGCFAEGETLGDAYEQLEKAAESWIEAALELSQEIPEPLSSHDYSGKLALRLPKSLHKKATFFAQQDGVSLNQFIICAIAEKIGEARASTNVLATYNQPMFSAGAGFVIGTGTTYGVGISGVVQSTAGNASVITSPNAAVIASEVTGKPKLQVIR